MIRVHIQPEHLLAVRFAHSPLIELTLSYHIVNNTEKASRVLHWQQQARQALIDTSLPYMDAVILPRYYMADFATPPPNIIRTNIEDEFERMRMVSDDVIRKNVQYVIDLDGMNPQREHFIQDPRAALECLIEEMRLYWKRTLAPHWARMRAVLENDVLYQARRMALQGVSVLLDEINPELRYIDGVINLKPCLVTPHDTDRVVCEPLQLVPSIFAGLSWQIEPEWSPMVIYTARGTGLWYSPQQPHTDAQLGENTVNPTPEIAVQPLNVLMGAGKTRVLLSLIQPQTTTELARKLELTPSAVSQHLGNLRDAGLVEPFRSGNYVFYRLSMRGERMLEVFND